LVSVYGVYVFRFGPSEYFKIFSKSVAQQAGVVYCFGFRLSNAFLFGATEGTEHAEGSFQTLLRDRRQAGALGGDADALVSPQREDVLTGISTAGGTAGRHALLALSLVKVRFAGKESIKLDRGEEVKESIKLDRAEEGMMVLVCKEVADGIKYIL
jgi:hypothetical protein